MRNEDDFSLKSEVQDAEMVINQIPTSKRELVLEPVTQTQLDSDGFRKPALPKAIIGPARSSIVSAEAVVPRHAPLKRPNQSSGRRSPMDPVESDIESSQELPPLKRAKLAPPRRPLFAEPRSFNSINQEAQDVAMRDHISPDLMKEPLHGWPSRHGHVPKPQSTAMDGLAQGSRLEKEARQTRTSLSKANRETQNEVPSLQSATGRNSSRPLPDHESDSERFNPGQCDFVRQDKSNLVPRNNKDNAGAGANTDQTEDNVDARDTFDIPLSPSPELPTSAQASRQSRLNVSGQRSGSSGQTRDRDFNRAKDRQLVRGARGRNLSRTSPKDGSLDNQPMRISQTSSLQDRQPVSTPDKVPQTVMNRSTVKTASQLPNGHIYKFSAQNLKESRSGEEATPSTDMSTKKSPWNVEGKNTDREGAGEAMEERSSEQGNQQQEPVLNSGTTQKSGRASMKPIMPSSIATSSTNQTQSRPRNITPAKKPSLKAPGNTSSILRSSTSRDRLSSNSVSFVDVRKEPAIDPMPTHQSASFMLANLPQEEKSEETLPLDLKFLERIKGGFKGVSKGNDSIAERTDTIKKLVKGKERAQERQESLSPRPKVAKAVSNEILENDEHGEPYTIDGNRGPSRNPGVVKSRRPSDTSEPRASQLSPQALNLSSTARPTERGQSVLLGRTESSGDSRGSSTPRLPAKEIVSPAPGNSAEAPVVDDSGRGSEGEQSESEGEQSESEGSEEAVAAQQEVRRSLRKSSTNASSTLNGPLPADHFTDMPPETSSSGTKNFTKKLQDAPSSGDESEDRAKDDDEADLQLRSENRRSIELGSSQKRPDPMQSPPSNKNPRTFAPQPKGSLVSQAETSNSPTRIPNAEPPASTNPPRASNGYFVGISALNAKSKTNGVSQKPLSNSTRPGQSNGVYAAQAIQIDSLNDSDDSSSNDSEVEIKADSKGRQSRNKALEGLFSVQNREFYLASTSWLGQYLT